MSQKQALANYYPQTYESRNIILLNMKNHYRRLYSVKPAVSTSPPVSYKLHLSRKMNKPVQSLSNRELRSTNSPASAFYPSSEKLRYETERYKSHRSIKPHIKKHSCIDSVISSHYFSPSKNKSHHISSDGLKNLNPVLIDSTYNKNSYLKDKVFDSSKSGSESSQDSAYNEGEVGSSGGGSRSPTPEKIANSQSIMAQHSSRHSSMSQRKGSNDHLYLEFLMKVTDEILKKGLVTNRALKQIFNDHLEANCNKLNQHRLHLELEVLRDTLGVPKDDRLNSADFGLGNGTDAPSCLPLIRRKSSAENCAYFFSNKSESVLENELAIKKNSLGEDFQEAFTSLNNNKQLIDCIQASIQSTSEILQRMSLISSQICSSSSKSSPKSSASIKSNLLSTSLKNNNNSVEGEIIPDDFFNDGPEQSSSNIISSSERFPQNREPERITSNCNDDLNHSSNEEFSQTNEQERIMSNCNGDQNQHDFVLDAKEKSILSNVPDSNFYENNIDNS